MLVIPVIQLKHNLGVEGDSSTRLPTDIDLADSAGRWFDRGFACLHIHNADLSEIGKQANSEVIRRLAFRFPNLTLQVSGVSQSQSDIEAFLKAGITFVSVDVSSNDDPDTLIKLAELYPRKLCFKMVLSPEMDVMDAVNLANRFAQAPLAGLILAPRMKVSRALDIDMLSKFASLVTTPVYASGELEDMDDIRALVAESARGISAVIVENAQLDQGLNLLEAQAYCNEFKD